MAVLALCHDTGKTGICWGNDAAKGGDFMDRKKKAFTLSFDDGVTQDVRLVELMNRYGLKGTFNLNTGIQSRESSFTIEGKQVCRMEQEGLCRLYEGHEVAAHGLTHAALPGLEQDALLREIGEDISNIEKYYGKRPVGFVYAYGVYDEKSAAALKKHGICYARTVEASHGFLLPQDLLHLSPTCHYRDENLMKLAETFTERTAAQPGLFYVWGHSYELDVHEEWGKLEGFFRYISDREDIYYGTNAECLHYLGVL